MIHRIKTIPVLLYPVIIGSVSGGICISYKEFERTKKEHFIINVRHTIFGFGFGSMMGISLGIFWPITLSVYIGRNLSTKK